MQQLQDNAMLARKIAAERTARVAAGLMTITLLLLSVNAIHCRKYDPLNPPRLTTVLAALNRDPANDSLKKRARKLDREVRSGYVRSRNFAINGLYLLLGGAVVFFAATEYAKSLRHSRPLPNPDRGRILAESALAGRRATMAAGASAAGLLLTLVVTSRHDPAAAWYKGILILPPDLPPATVVPPGGSSLGAPAPAAASLSQPTTTLTPLVDSSPATSVPLSVRSPVATTGPMPVTTAVVRTLSGTSTWPCFRGASGGIAVGTAPAIWNGPTGKGIKWHVPVPLPGHGSPVIWGDRIYLSGADETKREIYCFDTTTGKLLWRTPFPLTAGAQPVTPSKDTGYAPATVATDGSYVCAVFVNGDVVCANTSGKPVWRRSFGPLENMYGHASSPLLVGDSAIIQVDQGTDPDNSHSMIYALKLKSGDIAWKAARPVAASWTTPVALRDSNKTLVITVARPWVIAYNSTDGTEIWRAKCVDGEATPSPAVGNGMVYAGNSGAPFCGIRLNGSGDITKGGIAWSFGDNVPDIVSPVYTNGHVYLISSQGLITCLDAAKGSKVWEHDLATPCHASPVAASNRIYLTDRKGVTHVFDTGTTFKEIAALPLGEECSATPAVASGHLFLRGTNHLFCIGDR